MTDLRLLDVRGGFVTDDDLSVVHSMLKLEELNLSFNQLTDAGLAHLSDLTQLRSLQLDSGSASITSAGLKHLRKLQNLEYLNLAMQRGVDDAAVPQLLVLKKLKSVETPGTGLSEKARAELENELAKRRAAFKIEQEQQGQ